MLVRLALETRQHHAAADADRLALMELCAAGEYRDALARIYGFEVAVEHAVDLLPEPDRTFLATRGKRAHLARDLAALGLTELEIEQLPLASTRIATLAQALGWMFVVERHTMVAGLIARHLERTCPAWIATAGAYLGFYAESTGARLRAFGETLGEHVRHGTASPVAMVSAANEAFRYQRLWYGTSPLFDQLRARLDDPTKLRVIEAPSAAPAASAPEPVAPVVVDTRDDAPCAVGARD